MILDVIARGVRNLENDLDAANREEKRALATAIKVEGHRLLGKLRSEIRAGKPGGRPFAPLSIIRRRQKRRNNPLHRLAISTRYQVENNPFEFKFGWTDKKTSKSWRWIARKHQEGFESGVSQEKREYFHEQGERIGRRSKQRKFFFVRQDTKKMKTPARPILDPFWERYGIVAARNIRDNYRRKKRGERI